MTKQDILDYFSDINYAYNNCNKHDDLSRMLDELIETQPRWIPCSERLPEESIAVLVWCPERKNIYCAYFEENQWWIFGAYFQKVILDVIAWMPLPEPYIPDINDGKSDFNQASIKHKASFNQDEPTCSDCIIKDTDACSRGNTEADEVACEDFVGGESDAK